MNRDETAAAILLVGALLAVCMMNAIDAGKMYKLTPQPNAYEIGITCTNEGDPTVEGNFDGMLMVSCGK